MALFPGSFICFITLFDIIRNRQRDEFVYFCNSAKERPNCDG